MEKFVSVVSILALCSISGINGGAIPLSEERERIRAENRPVRRYPVPEPGRRYIPPRDLDLGTDFRRKVDPNARREELLDQLRIELNSYYDKKLRRRYLGPNGAPEVSGKSPLMTLTGIVDLATKLLPFLGITPPSSMSSGGQMMGGGGPMMMMSGAGQMMQGGGQMMQGSGQMMQGGGGNYILVPIYSTYPYPYYYG